jgi:hypothetical protein
MKEPSTAGSDEQMSLQDALATDTRDMRKRATELRPTNDLALFHAAEVIDVLRAAIGASPAAEAVGVPAGWKLVPVEPTEEMVSAAMQGAVFDERTAAVMQIGLRKNWTKMIAAAPNQPAAIETIRHAPPKHKLTDDEKAALAEASRTGATVAELPNGAIMFINHGEQPEDTAHLNCPHCGGSGHIGDVLPPQPVAAQAMTDEHIAEIMSAKIDCWTEIEPEDRGDIVVAGRALLASQPSQPAAGAQGDLVAQIIAELREEAHELRVSDSSAGIFADETTAAQLEDWAERLASAQPIEQKPFAWAINSEQHPTYRFTQDASDVAAAAVMHKTVKPLYTAPQQSTAIDVQMSIEQIVSIWKDCQTEAAKAFFDAVRPDGVTGGNSVPVRFAYALFAALKSSPPATEAGEQEGIDELMMQYRISLIPEYEGGWRADVYMDDSEGTASAHGATPREAIDNVLLEVRHDC